MFREVIADIQKIVDDMGENGGYDYILDSRNIMYAREDSDLTDQVIAELNKQ
jgi:Skp family chaperone for outer membrane proteins